MSDWEEGKRCIRAVSDYMREKDDSPLCARDLLKAIQAADKEIAQWKKAKEQVEAQLTRLSIECADIRLSADTEIARYRKELELANNSFGSMTAEWPGLANRIEEIKKQTGEQYREIATKNAELARLREQLKNLQEMYDRDVLEKMADEAGTDGYGRDV